MICLNGNSCDFSGNNTTNLANVVQHYLIFGWKLCEHFIAFRTSVIISRSLGPLSQNFVNKFLCNIPSCHYNLDMFCKEIKSTVSLKIFMEMAQSSISFCGTAMAWVSTLWLVTTTLLLMLCIISSGFDIHAQKLMTQHNCNHLTTTTMAEKAFPPCRRTRSSLGSVVYYRENCYVSDLWGWGWGGGVDRERDWWNLCQS